MARIPAGISGPVTGKVGPLIGSSWKGKPYIKARPRKRSGERGVIEAHNQTNFSILHHWLKPLLPFLREGFKGYAERLEGFNAAKSFNLKHAFTGENGNKVLDASKVQVSFGDLPLPSQTSFEQEDGRLNFRWDTALAEGGHRNDQVMLLAYDSETGKTKWKLTGQFREAGADFIELSEKGVYHIYLAFTAHDRSRRSHSMYLGKVEW